MSPDIIAFDEPSSNLDPNSQKLLIHTIKSLPSTKIVVTHDLYLAGDICSRLIILFNGEIVADDETEKVLKNQELLNKYKLPFGDRCRVCSFRIDSSRYFKINVNFISKMPSFFIFQILSTSYY